MNPLYVTVQLASLLPYTLSIQTSPAPLMVSEGAQLLLVKLVCLSFILCTCLCLLRVLVGAFTWLQCCSVTARVCWILRIHISSQCYQLSVCSLLELGCVTLCTRSLLKFVSTLNTLPRQMLPIILFHFYVVRPIVSVFVFIDITFGLTVNFVTNLLLFLSFYLSSISQISTVRPSIF